VLLPVPGEEVEMHALAFGLLNMTSADIPELLLRAGLMRDRPQVPVLVMPAGEHRAGAPISHELVWTPIRGRSHDESRRTTFIGALSTRESAVAEVRVITTAERRDLRRSLAGAMCPRCFDEPAAVREAERLLRAAAGLPEGTRVRLAVDGSIVPLSAHAPQLAESEQVEIGAAR
jgi:hypothetical protein